MSGSDDFQGPNNGTKSLGEGIATQCRHGASFLRRSSAHLLGVNRENGDPHAGWSRKNMINAATTIPQDTYYMHSLLWQEQELGASMPAVAA